MAKLLKLPGATRALPTPQQLRGALRKKVQDVIAPGLTVLFCGINPGRYSSATGHHFAGPGNRFWRTLHASGFTPRRLSPVEDGALLEFGLGVTNLVSRTTTQASELSDRELKEGGRILVRKARKFQPKVLAFVGLSAYRAAFGDRKAVCGLQPRMIGSSRVWLLPNPSGLNAHHQATALAELFRELRLFSSGL